MRDIYINSNLNTLTKFTSSSGSTEFKDIHPPVEHHSNGHEDHPNQHENSHKPHDEMGYPVLSLLEKSPKTNTLADGLIERTSSMLDEIGSKTVHDDEEGDRGEKK